ncbi:recombinase family protein [Planomonospora sp. ID67723]|nr:recombinase family protein [Planomonospora sp. ID67723]
MQVGDTLVIYKPDRIARSVKELLVFLEDELAPRGINLHILSGVCAGVHRPGGQSIADKMLFLVAAMAAEMERDLIRERTMDGLAAAAAQGRRGGRPPAIDADTLAAARARRARGETIPAIARALGVGRSTLYRAFEDDDPLVAVQRQETASRPIGDGPATVPVPGPAVWDWERVRPAPRRLADGYRVAQRSGDGRRYLLPPGSEVPIGYVETDGTRWRARTPEHEPVELDAVDGAHARQADALAALAPALAPHREG